MTDYIFVKKTIKKSKILYTQRGVIKLNVSRQRPMEEGRYKHVKKLDYLDFLAHFCKIYFVKKYMKKGKGGCIYE